MSDGILATASYACSKCGHVHSLGRGEIDFEAESSLDRDMGEECSYAAHIELPCDNCDQEICLKFEAWEYPVGIINDTNEEATGAEILSSDYEIDHQPPIPEEETEDGSRVLGAAAGGAIFGASVGGLFGALLGGIVGGLIGDSVQKGGKRNG